MLTPFESARLLIRRANTHLVEFGHAVTKFVDEKPYEVSKVTDAETGDTVLKCCARQPTLVELPAIAFDIVNCLRSALDHAMYDSVSVLTGEEQPMNTKFPMGADRKDAEKNISKAWRAKLPEQFLAEIIEKWQPYYGGCHKLREFNELRNRKIHRILSTFVFRHGGILVTPDGFGKIELKDIGNNYDEDGNLIYCTVGADTEPPLKIELSVMVTLDESIGFGRKPALDIFHEFAEVTARIVDGLQAVAERSRGAAN